MLDFLQKVLSIPICIVLIVIVIAAIGIKLVLLVIKIILFIPYIALYYIGIVLMSLCGIEFDDDELKLEL